MEHFNVLIATPGAMMEAQYVKSLVKTLKECNIRGITYKFLNNYSSLVHHARELTASGEEGLTLGPNQISPGGHGVSYDKIFWIDSDISWTPEQFFKIYDSEHDVVSGAYLLADGVTTTIQEWNKPNGMTIEAILKLKNPVKVQSIGFGFVAMKYGVFEKIGKPWFNHEYVKVGQTPDGADIIDAVGEDISWCIKAYRKGIDVYLDPSVLVTHMKKQPISWDKFIKQNNQNKFKRR